MTHCLRLLLSAALLALVGCGSDHEASPATDKDAPTGPARVQVAVVSRGSVVRTIALPASVRANFEVTLHAKATGFVSKIGKDRGDTVAAGEVIATLEIPELATDLGGARANASLAEATVKRLEAIRAADRDAVTDQDLDVERAKSATAAASLQRIEALLSYTEVRAPFAGRVTERFVDPGALVQQGPIVSLIDDGPRRILVDVPESDSTSIADGAAAELRFEALHDRRVKAAIARTAGRLDAAARTLRIELQAVDPQPELMPGMFGMATIELERHDHVLAVPAKAVGTERGESIVYTVVAGRAKRVAVTIGSRAPGVVEVTEGLSEGDPVILPGAGSAIHDGQAVQAAEAP